MSMKRPYKALLVDCDGTLAPARMEVTPRVRRAVTALSKLIPVCIVSSRDHHNIQFLASSLGFTSPQVSEGGARIFDPVKGETLWRGIIEPGDAKDIMGFLDSNKLSLLGIDGTKRVRSGDEVTDWEVTRITATSLRPEQAQEIAREFAAKLPKVHSAVIIRTDNDDWMVDFTHVEATKASAAKRVAGLLGVEPSQLIAAGDS
ncbi:MAG: HAD family phosphatase, partial [SAR202 cluster bacterium]|nr:HAD family phosphatase [SAR202 cluster bacterium]